MSARYLQNALQPENLLDQLLMYTESTKEENKFSYFTPFCLNLEP
jgi:hypothetical protein